MEENKLDWEEEKSVRSSGGKTKRMRKKRVKGEKGNIISERND